MEHPNELFGQPIHHTQENKLDSDKKETREISVNLYQFILYKTVAM